MVRVRISASIKLEISLNEVTVADLREFAAANAIVSGQIRQTTEGFILTFELSWRNDNTLFTTRHNRPRTWKSLDKLMSFLQKEKINHFVKSFELL
jgi:hypothetical protein